MIDKVTDEIDITSMGNGSVIEDNTINEVIINK